MHEVHRIWYTIYMHSAERDMCMDTVFWIALLVIVVLGCIGGWMLVRQMRRQSALLRRLREQSFVLRLLEDQSPEYAMDQQYIRDMQLDQPASFTMPNFCLIYLNIERFDSYILRHDVTYAQYCKTIGSISEEAERVIGKIAPCRCVEYRQNAVCLVNLPGKQIPEALMTGCRGFLEQTREGLDIQIRAAISTVYAPVTQTHQVMEWLSVVQDYRRFMGAACDVLCCEPLTDPQAGIMDLDRDTELLFFQAVLSEDLQAAEQVILSIVDRLAVGNTQDIKKLKSFIDHRIRSILNILAAGRTAELQMSVGLISEAESLENLKFGIHRTFQLLRDMQNKGENSVSKSGESIVNYLKEHYTESEMSLTYLSQVFGLSQSYISRLFKRETGEKLLDYLHLLRLNRAKELLTETELSVQEICKAVGYTTTWTMNRVFKSYEGVTPGSYREQHLVDRSGNK